MSLRRSLSAMFPLLVSGCALMDASGDGPGGEVPEGAVELVVPAGRVDADLVRYPVLVQVHDAPELAGPPDDGSDLELVQDGEILAHDVETFDADTGTVVAWVLFPLLAADRDNRFTVRRAGEVRASRAPEVWADFRGVWHLDDDADATGQGVVAIESGALGDDGAVIAGGVGLDGGYLEMMDPGDDHLDFALSESFTVSMWLRRDEATETWQTYLSKGGTTQGLTGYSIEVTEDGEEIYGCMADSDSYWCTDDALVPDGWVLVHFVVDRPEDEMRIYLDGVASAKDNEIFDVDPDMGGANDHPIRVGATAEGGSIAAGAADELRVRAGVLSPAWIAADAASQSDEGFVELAD